MENLILIILLITSGVLSGDWGVTFKSQCAFKGTSVVIMCEYDYPKGQTVTSVRWSKQKYADGQRKWFPVSTLSLAPDHFRYVGNLLGNCSMEVNDVQHTDNGKYRFTFRTTSNRWTSKKFADLSVKELTTVVQPSTVTEGDNVSLTCESGCPTLVDKVWFRDGQSVPNPVFQARREDAGSYYCAVLGQEMVRSASVALNVQYHPVNISVSLNPLHVVGGSSVNLTCSSAANPAAVNYTWYKGTTSPSSMVQIGSGQVLSIPSLDASHAGLYLCQARNQVGENNSTEVPLAMEEQEQHEVSSGISYLILPGIGVGLFASLMLSLLLFRRKQRAQEKKKQTVFNFRVSGRGSSSSTTEDQINSVNVDINTLPFSPVTDFSPHSQRSSHPELPPSHADEVTYSTVAFKPRNPSHHVNNSRASQDSRSKAGENDDSVIYATVAKSS